MSEIILKQQLWRDADGTYKSKAAELTGTYDMPTQEPSSKKPVPSKTGIKKTAGLTPRVSVRHQEPPSITEQEEVKYAMPSLGAYPLHDYEQVKRASAYFNETHPQLSPAHRREFAQNMVPRADELGIPASDLARKYASPRYAPPDEIEMALAARRSALQDEVHLGVLDKLANDRAAMPPGDYCLALQEFDKMASIHWMYGRSIPDPYFSTYGFEKTAKDDAVVIGNEYVTNDGLATLGKTGFDQLKSAFGEDFAKEFQKDPRGIFDSMPLDQKKMLARMASDNAAV